jgi:Zn-dependent protease with chaperone function
MEYPTFKFSRSHYNSSIAGRIGREYAAATFGPYSRYAIRICQAAGQNPHWTPLIKIMDANKPNDATFTILRLPYRTYEEFKGAVVTANQFIQQLRERDNATLAD